MADDVMAVDERLANLEVTVAKGFAELGGRLDRLEDRVDALNSKLDVTSESLEGTMRLVLERLDAHIHEVRVTTKAIVDEHRADRRLMYAMLQDHGIRIRALEHDRASLSGPAPVPEG
jgi:hypothetical protein